MSSSEDAGILLEATDVLIFDRDEPVMTNQPAIPEEDSYNTAAASPKSGLDNMNLPFSESEISKPENLEDPSAYVAHRQNFKNPNYRGNNEQQIRCPGIRPQDKNLHRPQLSVPFNHRFTAQSFVCWIWKDSVTAQQIGSGLGSIGLDWSTVARFRGSPLTTLGFAVLNVMAGFFLVVYVMLPITYWTNSYNAKRFPIFSSHVFDQWGKPYNISRTLNQKTFEFDPIGYSGYSQIHLSIFFAFTYGISFATLAATLSHVALFHGKSIYRQTKQAFSDHVGDVHTRLMKKNYVASSVVIERESFLLSAASSAGKQRLFQGAPSPHLLKLGIPWFCIAIKEEDENREHLFCFSGANPSGDFSRRIETRKSSWFCILVERYWP
ncbi:hypothetical protein EJ110_NYTH01627 [Nymphaea thermarum]|nr:hypothetical protein EJ110_NYTH01627 [Nymphaea thermarum]